MNLNKKFKNFFVVILSIVLLLAIIFDNLVGYTSLSSRINTASNSYKKVVDPSTMDSYQSFLLNDESGSRHAGRIWSDKSVFTSDIVLDSDTDGYNGTILNNSDFLHVFSALGSSLKISQPTRLDVMLLIDVSGSMGKIDDEYGSKETFEQTPMYKTINSVNETIKTLLEKSPESRFGIAIYGATAAVLVPLGHYTKANNDSFLKVEFKETYGGNTPQGLHFSFTASVKNDEGEVKTYYATNAGKTSDEAHGTSNSSGNRTYKGTGGQTSGTGTKQDPYEVGHITNQQAGLAAAMDQFITDNKEITWKSTDDVDHPRIPALIHLTDGQASDIAWIQDSAEENSDEEWKKTYSNWNNVNWKYDLAYNSKNKSSNSDIVYNASQLSGAGDAAPLIFQTLMTAAYYKSAVDAYYASSGVKDLSGASPTLNCYSIYASDSAGYESMENDQVKGTINAILDPSNFFKDLISESTEVDSGDLKDKEEATGDNYIDTAYELYKKWIGEEKKVDHTFSKYTTSGNTANDITINIKASQSQLNDNSGAYAKQPWADKIDVEAIKKNIYYVPSGNFFKTNFTNVGSVLDNIIKSVANIAFTPVGGTNDTGTSDSLTFMDPIGQYMEVKDKAVTIEGQTYDMDLLLFGKNHGMKKTAVYDYKFNNTHRGKNHNSSETSEKFISGWYDKNGEFKGSDANDGSWENGDTYYLDDDTVRSYVSNLSEDGSMTEQQRNTVYTIYRFIENDRNTDEKNPCYEDNKTTFKLSDIRVWVEDTENFEDDNSGGSPDLGFDRALYVNIPVSALPIQVAKVEINGEGKVASYKTNLSEKTQSTPFRLFYGIGVEDAIYTEDGLDIDLTKLSPEYLQKNKIGDFVYFYSNYYSNTVYDGYVTDSRTERTRGDAYFSFSPDSSNRYYIYQNPLPLYEITDTDLEEDGTYKDVNLFDEQSLSEFKSKHNLITDSSKVNSESWYYVIIDYYMPNQQDQVHVAVARKGSEFGSGIAGDSVEAGAYLSWYNETQNEWRPYVVGGAKPTDGEGEWIVATRPGGLRVGDMAQSLQQKVTNSTNTAYNSYLPTISASSETGKENNIIVNSFLGNNGRLQVNDSLLYITKEVKNENSLDQSVNVDKEFNFKVKFDGREGDFSAIKAVKNPYSNEWQLRISTVDILTNNDGFLQDTNTNLYVHTIGRSKYYVYIGNNKASGIVDGDNVFRVYSAPDNEEDVNLTLSGMTTYVNDPDEIDADLKTDLNKYKKCDEENSLGSLDLWVKNVYLIPTREVDNGTWNKSTSGYQSLSEFVVAHLDSYLSGANELSSPYKISAAYLTTKVFFGYTDENKPSTKPEDWSNEDWENQIQNVANVKLKNDEGLMFSGLRENTPYEVEEIISDEEQKEGYYLDEIKVTDEEDAKANGSKVTGTVTSDLIDEIHYYNRYYGNSDLSLSKIVKGSLGEKDKEWTFNVKLTPDMGTILKDTYTLEGSSIEGVELPTQKSITLTKQEDGSYTGDIKLKHGQTVVIKDIQQNTQYEITEVDANKDEYVTTAQNDKGILTTEKTEVSFENAKQSKHDIVIEKEVVGTLANKDEEWTINLKLISGEDFPLTSEYSYTSSYNGEDSDKKLSLTKDESDNYIGSIKIKNGEKITIKDLPEGTTYEVTEKEANQNGYTTKIEGENTGLLSPEKENPSIKFTNMKLTKHNLKITKVVSGSAGEKDKDWKFTIKLTPLKLVDLLDNYSATKGLISNGETGENTQVSVEKNTDAIIHVSLKDGEFITIKDLPEGTTYEVVEDEANQNEYITWIDGNDKGTLQDDETVEINFNNKKPSKQTLTLSKEVAGGAADINKEWHFEIVLTPDDHVTLNDAYSYQGTKEDSIKFEKQEDGTSIGEVTLKHGETIVIQDLPENTSYSIKEKEANEDEYVTEVTGNDEGKLNEGNTKVAFKNTKLSKQTLTIKKIVTGDLGDKNKVWNFKIKLKDTILEALKDKYNYELTTKDNTKETKELILNKVEDYYEGSFTLKDSETIVIQDLPEGTEYTISEDEANQEGYVTEIIGNNSDVLSTKNVEVTFNNANYSKHDLAIKKTVVGNLGDKNKEWEFKVRLTPAKDIVLSEKYVVEYTNFSDNQFISKEEVSFAKQPDGTSIANIKIKHGQIATIKGIQINTAYNVTELDANKDGYVTTSVNETGNLVQNHVDVSFENAKYSNHNIVITKEVAGELGDKDREWNFNVKLMPGEGINLENSYPYISSNMSNSGVMNLTSNEDGSYSGILNIKHGETVTISGIPELTTYEVTEVEADQDGYSTIVDGETNGVLGQSENVNITFKNVKYSNHSLVIEKEVVGGLGDKEKEWKFQVVLTPGIDVIFNKSYPYKGGHFEGDVESPSDGNITLTQKGDKYIGTISMKHGQSITIENLPEGTTYEVTELDANKQGYITTDSGNNSGLLDDDIETVRFTNTKLALEGITISKQVIGAWGDTEKEWQFKLNLTPLEDAEIKNSYSYEGSKDGTIEITDNEDGTYTGKFTLKHDEMITINGIPEGTSYEVIEDEANQDGYSTQVVGNATGKLIDGVANPVIDFKNIKLSQHSLLISKNVSGSDGDTEREWDFTVYLTPTDNEELQSSYNAIKGKLETIDSSTENIDVHFEKNDDGISVAHIKLRHGEFITINDLPEGTEFEVVEDEANKNGYTTWTDNDNVGVLENSSAFAVNFNNIKPSKHDITLSKEVLGRAGEVDKEWNFEIILTPADHITLADSYSYQGSKEGYVSFTKQSDGTSIGNVSLKHNETIVIKDLPENTKYSIREIEANQNGYVTKVEGNESGILTEKNNKITYKNTKLSNYGLIIKKTVSGDLGDKNREWSFRVILKSNTMDILNNKYAYEISSDTAETQTGYIEFTQIGSYYEGLFTLRDGEQILIMDLPEGSEYKVVENEANQDGYITTIKGNTEGVLLDRSSFIEFNNMKYSKNILSIEKVLNGSDVDYEKEWTFEIRLKANSTLPFNTSYIYTGLGTTGVLQLTLNDEGVYVGYITLKGGEKVSINDIPAGTEYEIRELEENTDGYTTTYSNNAGILDKNVDVVFINERNIELPNTFDSTFKYFIAFIGSLITVIGGFIIIEYRRETN